MKKDKLVYEAPEAEIFEVRFGGGMLMSSNDPDGYGKKQGGVPTLGEDEDYGSV